MNNWDLTINILPFDKWDLSYNKYYVFNHARNNKTVIKLIFLEFIYRES